jgi:hypothetical protein
MTKKLRISDDLALPIEVVTQKLAWLGVTGGGKTYAAQKLAELLWDLGAQFVAFDPVGVWYGLRLAKDGKSPSDITIPIFGGLHGDLPLEATAGALMADLIVDRGISAIVDVSQFESDAQKARFAADFADRFFFRKKGAPSAVHLFVEECQEFVPQNTMKGEERMLHAFTRLQKLGRNFGVGSSYVSQRPQEVNKKALNMAQTLFVFRTTGPQERKAIDGWIAEKGLDQNIAGDLPKLKTGTCHVWSPEFLGVSEVVCIAEKRTFNASATPEVGATAQARHLAPIDLDRIRTDMAATIERARADDPKELRKRIADLECTVNTASPPVPTDRDVVRVQAAAMREARQEWSGRVAALEATIAELKKRLTRIGRFIGQAHDAHEAITQELGKETPSLATPAAIQTVEPTVAARLVPVGRTAAAKGAVASSDLSGPEQRIIDAVAWLESIGITAPEQTAVAFLAGYTVGGGAFNNPRGALRTKGLIDYRGSSLVLTDAGRAKARWPDEALTAAELQRRVLDRLPGPEQKILRVLLDEYPKALDNDTLARRAGYEPGGGAFNNPRGRLRTLGLIGYPERGRVAAQPVLFLEERP